MPKKATSGSAHHADAEHLSPPPLDLAVELRAALALRCAVPPSGVRLRQSDWTPKAPNPPHTLPHEWAKQPDSTGTQLEKTKSGFRWLQEKIGSLWWDTYWDPWFFGLGHLVLKTYFKSKTYEGKIGPMAKHHIYIKESVEKTLAAAAKKSGTTTRDLIRAHIENLSVGIEMDAVQKDLKTCLDMLTKLTKALELVAEEVGFSSGVLASKSARDPEATASGNANARRLKLLVAASATKGEETSS